MEQDEMKYRYRYINDTVEMIEGSTDPAVKMAIVWRNQDQESLHALMRILYDFRYNWEIAKIPAYSKKRSAGIEFHTAVKNLDTKLNQRLLGAGQKFAFLVDTLQQLQDRDAEVLERALTGNIDLGIPIEDIQRAYPDIEPMPMLAENSMKAPELSNLTFPGIIARQPQGAEIRVVINQLGNFKFVAANGKALVFPDKTKSVFRRIFKDIKNVTLCATLVGLTKDQSKVGNTATGNSVFAKMQVGELEVEQVGIRIFDAVDMTSYRAYPAGNQKINMTYEARLRWLKSIDFGDNIFARVVDTTPVASIEDLREMENDISLSKDTIRFYSELATFHDGFRVLSERCF